MKSKNESNNEILFKKKPVSEVAQEEDEKAYITGIKKEKKIVKVRRKNLRIRKDPHNIRDQKQDKA